MKFKLMEFTQMKIDEPKPGDKLGFNPDKLIESSVESCDYRST